MNLTRGKLNWRSWLATPPAAGSRMSVVSRVRLTAAHTMHVVELDGRRWLVLCHPSGGEAIAEVTAAAEASA